MQVFVTGATGFIGTALVDELIGAGHRVRGLARSDAGAEQLRAAGAEVQRGSLEDTASLRTGAAGMDAVAHLAFGLDMANFAQNAEIEVAAIETLGASLEPGSLLIVTSGLAGVPSKPGSLLCETDAAAVSPMMPRRPDQSVQAWRSRGLNTGVVRMSQIHDSRKQGVVQFMVQIARATGVSAYVEHGASRWSACSLADTARLYRLALEKNATEATYHAVDEQGVALKAIAEALGTALGLPVASLSREEATAHFGPIAPFLSMDIQGSSELTRQALHWQPTGPALIDDILVGGFAA
jgi:nucleoside-diphosphate-sugar epimerase